MDTNEAKPGNIFKKFSNPQGDNLFHHRSAAIKNFMEKNIQCLILVE